VSVTNATVLITGDPHARYFGAELGERSPIPGAAARLGEIRFQEWLGQSCTSAAITAYSRIVP
jgi:hypothetical protein